MTKTECKINTDKAKEILKGKEWGGEIFHSRSSYYIILDGMKRNIEEELLPAFFVLAYINKMTMQIIST